MTTRRFRPRRHDLSLRIWLVVGAGFLGGWAWGPQGASADWVEAFSFDPAHLTVSEVRGFHELSLPGCVVTSPEGAPRLPVYLSTFCVPEGEAVIGIEVVEVSSEALSGRYDILPGGGELLDRPVRKDLAIWAGTDPYPAEVAALGQGGFMRGVRVASVLVYPVQFLPAEGQIVFNRRVVVKVRTGPSDEVGVRSERAPGPRVTRAAKIELGRSDETGLVGIGTGTKDGAAPSGLFQPTEYPSLDGSLVEYLIIAADDLASESQRLADWKTSCGIPAVVKTVSWIEANYPGGVDIQEKIRFFIRDAYEKWGTVWVLLVGDHDTVPTRQAHIDYYAPGDWLLGCDMYFQCLDGNWNADGDHLFGEGYKNPGSLGDSADFYPDVYLGRASVETVDEASNFIDNAMAYRTNPSLSGYLTSVLFLGEVVFPMGWDPGDPIYLDGADICEQAVQWVASHWDTVKLYEIYGNENHDAIQNEMNAGHGIVAVVNHGDAFKMSCSDDSYLYLTDMDSLQNFDKMGFMYVSNCNLSQIEMDCFDEHLTQNLNRGYTGAIGPTQFCFPHAERDFMEEVFRLIFAAGTTRLGEIEALHKLPFISVSEIDNSAYRWTTLSYILLGDPELPIWVYEPEALNVVHAGSMSLGDSTYTVTATSGGSPVAGLVACLWKEDTGEYARGLTDANGEVVLSFEPGSQGSASLVVIGDGYLPYEGTVSISGTGRVHISQTVVDDATWGNGDGRWDGGEQVELEVTLHNSTSLAVENVTGTLGLVSGETVTIDLTFNGASDPGLLSIGAGAAHPAGLPAVYTINEEVLLGRPRFTGAAAPDTGVYFWLDRNGWHVRTVGGLGEHSAWVSVSTSSQPLDVEALDLEDADSLWVGSQEFRLFAEFDSTDYEDGVDAVLGDTVGVTIVSGSAGYGTIGAGSSQTESFTASALPTVADGVPIWMVLDISSGADTWTEWIRVDIHGPRLSEYYHGIDDSTYGGNGNGKAEVGETVILRSAVLNRGSGTASGVTGILRGIAGVDVSDSTDTIGTLQPGEVVYATGGFVFTSLSSAMRLSLELTDGEGRQWVETFELSPPSAPTGLASQPAPDRIDLRWDVPPEVDVFGYNVYRREGRGPYQRVTTLLDEGTAYHRDVGLVPETHYVYRVAAVDTSGNVSALSDTLDAWSAAAYMPGFPVSSLNQFFSSPAIGDIDGDTDLEIVIGSKDGFVYAWHHTGELVSGWPRDTGGEVWCSPALTQLDEDPQAEVLVGTWANKIFAWNHDGTGLLSPDGTFASVPRYVRSSPTCQDVDWDGRVEVFAGCSNGRLYAWNHDGTGYINADGLFAFPGGGEIASSPAIADVDGDLYLEIFVGSMNGKLYAWNHDGTGYLDSAGVFADLGGGIWSSPAIGDIDNNGDLEILVGSFTDSVYAWHHDGSRVANWPRGTSTADIWASPALGDLDNDGDLEIVIGSDDFHMWAWHHDGTGVALPSGQLAGAGSKIWSSAALADLDGNGFLDIVVGTFNGLLYAWNRTGKVLPGWPVSTWDGIYSSPAVGDLDQDGDVEVVCASYDGMLYVYDLGAAFDPERADWPMFQHDTHRTGYYGFDGVADVESEESLGVVMTGLDQNYPNPFNPETVIAYRISSTARVELAVYDVRGRRVQTLVSGEQQPGVYQVSWRGENARGIRVASGVYFCRLEVGSESFSRKMVLLK